LGWPQSSASVGDFAIFKLSQAPRWLYIRAICLRLIERNGQCGFGGITLARTSGQEDG